MKKIIVALISSLVFTTPVMADPEVKGWKTYDSMGCMLLGECTDDVRQVKSLSLIHI